MSKVKRLMLSPLSLGSDGSAHRNRLYGEWKREELSEICLYKHTQEFPILAEEEEMKGMKNCVIQMLTGVGVGDTVMG